MRAKSAGLLLYRIRDGQIEILVCHTGGPYGRGPDKDRWSLPKGKIEEGENYLETAKRETQEETGIDESMYDNIFYVGMARQSRKDVYVYAARYLPLDDPIIVSSLTRMEWPRKSGQYIEVPEVDRGEFVPPEVAKYRLIRGQKNLVDLFIDILESKKS